MIIKLYLWSDLPVIEMNLRLFYFWESGHIPKGFYRLCISWTFHQQNSFRSKVTDIYAPTCFWVLDNRIEKSIRCKGLANRWIDIRTR